MVQRRWWLGWLVLGLVACAPTSGLSPLSADPVTGGAPRSPLPGPEEPGVTLSPLPEPGEPKTGLSPLPEPSPASPVESGGLFSAAWLAQVAEALGVAPETLQVSAAEPVDWPDTSLGCPQPGMMYAQVITPGWRVTLLTGEGQQHEVHTGRQPDHFVVCTGGPRGTPAATR